MKYCCWIHWCRFKLWHHNYESLNKQNLPSLLTGQTFNSNCDAFSLYFCRKLTTSVKFFSPQPFQALWLVNMCGLLLSANHRASCLDDVISVVTSLRVAWGDPNTPKSKHCDKRIWRNAVYYFVTIGLILIDWAKNHWLYTGHVWSHFEPNFEL